MSDENFAAAPGLLNPVPEPKSAVAEVSEAVKSAAMLKRKTVLIDRTHSQAICAEISERLRYMPSETESMPSYLFELTDDLFVRTN
jgi:hypothetical protein